MLFDFVRCSISSRQSPDTLYYPDAVTGLQTNGPATCYEHIQVCYPAQEIGQSPALNSGTISSDYCQSHPSCHVGNWSKHNYNHTNRTKENCPILVPIHYYGQDALVGPGVTRGGFDRV